MPARATHPVPPAPHRPQPPPTSRLDPSVRRRLSAPGLRSFLAIADLWKLTEEQRRLLLGYPSRSTYHHWCHKARAHESITLDADVLTRISAVLGIHQALATLFTKEADGLAWLRGPHQALVFGGQAPLHLLTCGSQDALLTVRRFLEGARSGIYMPPNALDADPQPYEDDEIIIT